MGKRDKNANKYLHRRGVKLREAKQMGVQIPGQARVQVDLAPGPNVAPVTVNAQVAGGMIVKQYGGFTKLEELAARFACALVQSEKSRGMDREAVAAAAVELAELVIAACNRVQYPPAPAEGQGEGVAGGQ